MNFVQVVNGEVVDTAIPESGVLADGRPVSNYHLLPEETLEDEGWIPVVEDSPPDYDPGTHNLVADGYEVRSDGAVAKYRLDPLGPSIVTNRTEIPADGLTESTVTYRHPAVEGRPESVKFVVNDVLSDAVALDENGNASVQVSTDTAGPITIYANLLPDRVITLFAEER